MNKKYKLKPYDKVHNIWLLYEKVFWFFYKYVSAGQKDELEKWVKNNP